MSDVGSAANPKPPRVLAVSLSFYLSLSKGAFSASIDTASRLLIEGVGPRPSPGAMAGERDSSGAGPSGSSGPDGFALPFFYHYPPYFT